MYTLYILKSRKDRSCYVGMTNKDPRVRTKEHNSNKSGFTRGHQPWALIYSEQYSNKNSAMKREKFLKSGLGRKWIDNNVDNK